MSGTINGRRTCLVEGCNSVPQAKGYCGRHATQLKRKGRIVPDDEPRPSPRREPMAPLEEFLSRDFAIEAEAGLAEELRPIWRSLVDDYRREARFFHGHAYVSVKVLAELVRLGWRKP